MLSQRGAEYHPVVRRRLLRGRLLPAADYMRAQRLRRHLADELTAAMAALLLPLAPVPAYDLHDRPVQLDAAGQHS